jgi:hypothetical protein
MKIKKLKIYKRSISIGQNRKIQGAFAIGNFHIPITPYSEKEVKSLEHRSKVEKLKADIARSQGRQRNAKRMGRQSVQWFGHKTPSYASQQERAGLKFNVASGEWERKPTGRYNIASGLWE